MSSRRNLPKSFELRDFTSSKVRRSNPSSTMDSIECVPDPATSTSRNREAPAPPDLPRTFAEWKAFYFNRDEDLVTAFIFGCVMFGIFLAAFFVGFGYEKSATEHMNLVTLGAILFGGPLISTICACAIFLAILRARMYQRLRRERDQPRSKFYGAPTTRVDDTEEETRV